ncbi:MAG: methylthioribulose 1-phosphate dehydratase [Acidimicrobiales bacterium]
MTAEQDSRRVGRELAAEAARYASLGWMRGTSGNLSVVLSRSPLRLAVTASGRDKGELSADDVVVVDELGGALPDQTEEPSAEAQLHAVISAVTGAGAVVHVHSTTAVLAAQRFPGGVGLEGLEMLKALGRAACGELVTIPVIENCQDMSLLGERFRASHDGAVPVVIVSGHGLYAWGGDLRQARRHTEAVDWLLKVALGVP